MDSHVSRNHVYIAGGPGGNSIGPAVHEHIAKSLGLDWTCEFLRLASIDDITKIYRAPTFAGGLVTMPHKRTIIPLLDQCDDLVRLLGACSLVYLTRAGQLCGTNTDWIGIHDAILAVQDPDRTHGKVAMVYGAGGASRAAVYALWARLGCSKIYIVNRDDQEVEELVTDSTSHGDLYQPEIVHIRTVAQAKQLPVPYTVVSTVPDFEPVSAQEIEAADILAEFMNRDQSKKGLILDMCYHPPMTRILKLGQKFGWNIIQGFTASAHQFPLQWKLMTGKDIDLNQVLAMVERLVHERDKERQDCK